MQDEDSLYKVMRHDEIVGVKCGQIKETHGLLQAHVRWMSLIGGPPLGLILTGLEVIERALLHTAMTNHKRIETDFQIIHVKYFGIGSRDCLSI